MTEAEYKDLMRGLIAWEQGGGVVNKPPRAGSADHPTRPAPSPPHNLTPEQRAETEASLAHMKSRMQAARDATRLPDGSNPTG